MSKVVLVFLIVLCVLHHDVWWWDSAEPLVFGFMPIGLAWHAGISLGAGLAWWLATRFCWPKELEPPEESQ